MRPSTSMSHRRTPDPRSQTPSSASRPSSVASLRTASRISQRPTSRLSQRSNTRQSARVGPQLQALVTSITGMDPAKGAEDFEDMLDVLARKIDSVTKQAMSTDMKTIYQQLKGFSDRSRIHSHEQLAEAFDSSIVKLREVTKKQRDLDDKISRSKLADHLQFLLMLSAPPSRETLKNAADFLRKASNPEASSNPITWEEILREEPYEGQHWEGAYGLPPGSIAGGSDVHSTESSPYLSPLDDSDLDYRDDLYSDIDAETEESMPLESPTLPKKAREDHLVYLDEGADNARSRRELEVLRDSQYWRPTPLPMLKTEPLFNINEPDTLHILFRHLQLSSGPAKSTSPSTISEHEMVREVLFGLQDRKNIIFQTVNEHNGIPSVEVSSSAPRLQHFSPASQLSLLNRFAFTSTLTTRIRQFADLVCHGLSTNSTGMLSKTLEAFADALFTQLAALEKFAAQKETRMIRAPLQEGDSTVISLMGLERDIQLSFSHIFEDLFQIIDSVFSNRSWLSFEGIASIVTFSPSTFSSRLHDEIFERIQQRHAVGDDTTAIALLHTFSKTAEPLWQMLGRWLRDGIFMPTSFDATATSSPLPAEFFIEYNGLNLSDPDFWTDGFSLRSRFISTTASMDDHEVPLFLKPLAEQILSAGKSIGFLRLLGDDVKSTSSLLAGKVWPSFDSFLFTLLNAKSQPIAVDELFRRDLTTEKLTLLLSDHLLPICEESGISLKKMFFSDCDFMFHLERIEDVFLMRRADVMSDFCDILFSAIDMKKLWTDFYFLNTAFGDIVSTLKNAEINSGPIRISYKADRRHSLQLSVNSLDGISFEYAAPFPLTLVFTPDVLQRYNAILVMLLQLKRAKAMLDAILLRGHAGSVRTQAELKVFYVMRSKLSWIVNTLLGFISVYVLHVKTKAFHEELQASASLDGVIELHQTHLTSLETLCFLDTKTNNVKRAITSILDISVGFSDTFAAFSGDTSLSISRSSLTHTRRHRSKKQRRERRNVVSYVPVKDIIDDSSSDSDLDLDESEIVQSLEGEQSVSLAETSAYESFTEDDLLGRTEKMMKDLDQLVRYVRREVERLVTSHQTFGVLAFSLQDWDL